jgi:acyl-CoA dehydrogenase
MSEFVHELTDLIRNLAAEVQPSADDQIARQWAQIQELGLTAIGIAEAAGGSGGGLDDLVVVIRELARAGLATPIVEASVAAFTIGVAPQGTFDTIVINRAENLAAQTLTCDLGTVPFAALAGRIVVVGDSDIVTIPVRQDGVEVEPSTDIAGLSIDQVRLAQASHQPVHGSPDPHTVRDRLTLARSAALLGSAYGAYDLTRQYVADRQQFGAPLIKIPAVSGALAQMVVRIRNARSAVDRAVEVCADGNSTPLRRFAAVASARVATAGVATLVAQSAHQLHGAVGVTSEYGLHRYTRTLWALRDADESERMLSGRLGNAVLSAGEAALWDEISA